MKNKLADKLTKIFVVFHYYPKYLLKNSSLLKRFFKLFFLRGLYSAFQDAYDFLQLPSWQNEGKKVIKKRIPLDAKLTEDYQILNFSPISDPEVSIIIPVCNKFKYTFNCLKSILEAEPNLKYEIIIADDNSTDETQKINDYYPNAKVLRNNPALGFLKNCNQATRNAQGKYLLFLNNDTKVQKNFLTHLLDAMNSNSKIGIIGSKLVYPDGELQEAGGIVWCDGTSWSYGKHQDPSLPEYNYAKEVDYVSGACLMIRKNLWDEIGGFDERYQPAYYEDADLAFEVRKRDYIVVYQPKSVVIHFENISYGRGENDNDIKNLMMKNRDEFLSKWRQILDRDHFRSGENILQASDRNKREIYFNN